MAGMSISGLASGLDTTTLISQLMQLETRPQDALKTRLTDAKADASAYRTINSTLSTLRSAAEALTKATTWTPTKATSSAASVSATASAGATPGSVAFTVSNLAATHTMIGSASWTPPAGETVLTIEDKDKDTPATSITIAAGTSLADAVTAINAKKAGVTASAVNTGAGYRLQLTSTTSGLDGAFTVSGGPGTFTTVAEGADAQLSVAGGIYTATSSTNTFSDLMAGTTFTVNEKGASATVTVVSDPAGVATAVQSLVTAANNALNTLSEYGNNSPGSKAVLRGDSTLRDLAGQVLDAVSHAVGNGSPAAAGLQLNREGRITFDSAAFTAKLRTDPTVARRLVDGEGGVPGVAQRLLSVTKTATDATTGTLTALAVGKDREATDLQGRIDSWDLRLELRRQSLTKQFTAMEAALGGLQSKSSWLSSQLSSLPSWSRS
jgi:flagellar hook-associated protein 2